MAGGGDEPGRRPAPDSGQETVTGLVDGGYGNGPDTVDEVQATEHQRLLEGRPGGDLVQVGGEAPVLGASRVGAQVRLDAERRARPGGADPSRVRDR